MSGYYGGNYGYGVGASYTGYGYSYEGYGYTGYGFTGDGYEGYCCYGASDYGTSGYGTSGYGSSGYGVRLRLLPGMVLLGTVRSGYGYLRIRLVWVRFRVWHLTDMPSGYGSTGTALRVWLHGVRDMAPGTPASLDE